VVQLADHPALRLAPPAPAAPADQAAARRSLREQIARLERRLADALVSTFPHEPFDVAVPGLDGPRLLDLGELEALRDDLAARLRAARQALDELAERREQARLLLESMYAQPGHHRFVRLARRDLGLPGCGVYQVRPRLGLVGMLAGWWHVKLSSGCPLAGRGEPAVQRNTLPPWAAAAANAR
jgi:hypothetical protein